MDIEKRLDRIQETVDAMYLNSLSENSVKLLDTAQIAKLLSRSYTHVYRSVVSQPDFPKPVSLDGSDSGHRLWRSGEVVQWIKRL